jgi:hypothetical protein
LVGWLGACCLLQIAARKEQLAEEGNLQLQKKKRGEKNVFWLLIC